MIERNKNKNFLENFIHIGSRMDITLFIVVIFLMAFGIIMVYSSTFNLMTKTTKDSLWVKQAKFALLAIIAMLSVSRIKLKFINVFLPIMYIGINTLLVYVIIAGPEDRGARRTMDFGGFSFQPSELAKIIVILVLARLLYNLKEHMGEMKVLVILCTVLIVPVLLIAKEDFSTGVLLFVIGAGMIFTAYRNIWHMISLLGGAMIMIVVGFLTLSPNRLNRFRLYSGGPWQEADGKGRQTVQSLYAIGSGKITGRGLGQSIQKMGKISQAHHDIIFAIICEELGLAGGILIILLYLGLILRLMQIAFETSNLNSFLIVIGVMIQLASQVFISIGVATNLLPNTGIPLPFISYGGSSLLTFAIGIGIVLSISRENQANNSRVLG